MGVGAFVERRLYLEFLVLLLVFSESSGQFMGGDMSGQFLPVQSYGMYGPAYGGGFSPAPGFFLPPQQQQPQMQGFPQQPSMMQQDMMRQQRMLTGPFMASPNPQMMGQGFSQSPAFPTQFGSPQGQFLPVQSQPVDQSAFPQGAQGVPQSSGTQGQGSTPFDAVQGGVSPPVSTANNTKNGTDSQAVGGTGDQGDSSINARSLDAANSTTGEGSPGETNNKTDTIPKSELFNFTPSLSDPTSIEALKSQVKLTRFQIWWVTNQILPQVNDRLRPDYVLMLPTPFQQGIPTVNLSQILISPAVRHETLRTLIDVASGFLPSQLAVLLQRIRLSEPAIIRNIIGSRDPGVILSQVNPRDTRRNIVTIIRTIMDMPETGRFGITSVQAKLLPPTLLQVWLRFVNQTRWTAMDLLGQSPVGAAHELQLAILGLSCIDIRSLPPPDLLPVLSYFRRELYSLRFFQDISFPICLRRCLMDKLLEFLASKPGNANHILDKLTPAEIKAIGGEVLSAIPTAALKKANAQTQYFIIGEISRIDPISVIKFANIKKLQWLAATLFGVNQTDIESQIAAESAVSGRSTSDTGVEPGSLEDGDSFPEIIMVQEMPADAPTGTEKEQAPTSSAPTNVTGEKTRNAETPDSVKANATEIVTPSNNQTETAETLGNVDSPTANKTDGISVDNRRRRRSHDMTADELHRMGSLYCYAIPLLDAHQWSNQTVREFLDQKESVGQRTCCMSKSLRKKWNVLLKETFGSNITSWSEFDLSSMGDLLIALTDRELKALSLDNLSKVVGSLIKQSGLNQEMRLPGHVSKLSFVKACEAMLPDDEAEQFQKAQLQLYKRLAQAAQWFLSTSQPNVPEKTRLKITCDGLILAGPAAVGYSASDLLSMEPKEMFDCIETLGTLDFDDEVKFELLQFFKETFHLSMKQLNIVTLIELGKLIPEFSLTDIAELPLFLPSAFDSVAVLGTQITNTDLLQAVGTKFTNDNRILPGLIGSRSFNFRVVIRSLGNIFCGLSEHAVSNILESDATIMLDTSTALGSLEGCPTSVLNVIAAHAIRPSNYGPPETWSVTDVSTMGVIIAGLSPDLLARIRANSMEGLTPLAMRSLTPAAIQALTTNQIHRITPDAALAIDFTKAQAMSQQQKDALRVTIAIDRDTFFVDHRVSRGNTRLFAGFLGDSDDQSTQELPLKPVEILPSPKNTSDVANTTVTNGTSSLEARSASDLNGTDAAVNSTLGSSLVPGSDGLGKSNVSAGNETDPALVARDINGTSLNDSAIVDTNGTWSMNDTAPEAEGDVAIFEVIGDSASSASQPSPQEILFVFALPICALVYFIDLVRVCK